MTGETSMIAGSRSIRHLFASYFIFHCSAHTATPCYFPLLFYHIIIIIIIFIPFHHWALDWTCTAQHTAHTRWWRHCVLLHNPLLFTVAFVWSIHQVFSFSLNKKKDDIRSILKFNVETINNYSPQRRKKKTKFLPTCGEEKFGE